MAVAGAGGAFMKVREIMSENIGVCGPDDSLASAVRVMWDKDCGIVPIVDDTKLIGVVTDRDIAIFVATQYRLAIQVNLRELVDGSVIVCRERDSIAKVLKKMNKHGVRRLPVVNKSGQLKGMISITDILRASLRKKDLRKRVVRTLADISKPRKIVLIESEV